MQNRQSYTAPERTLDGEDQSLLTLFLSGQQLRISLVGKTYQFGRESVDNLENSVSE